MHAPQCRRFLTRLVRRRLRAFADWMLQHPRGSDGPLYCAGVSIESAEHTVIAIIIFPTGTLG
jgi:hypothetical protein